MPWEQIERKGSAGLEGDRSPRRDRDFARRDLRRIRVHVGCVLPDPLGCAIARLLASGSLFENADRETAVFRADEVVSPETVDSGDEAPHRILVLEDHVEELAGAAS
jgi:hypothetical protein